MKFSRYISFSLAVFVSLAPSAAFAAAAITNNNLQGIIQLLAPIFQGITQILAATALLGFFWGTARFIWNGGDEKKRAEGRYVMIWGIVAFFFLLSISGVVGLLQNTFQLQNVPLPVPSADPKTYGFH